MLIRKTGFMYQSLRRLLQVDKTVTSRSDEELSAEVERNYRWNYIANLLDVAFYWLGNSFASATTIIPLFVSKLTPSPFAIGLVAIIAQSGWSLPQIFTANVIEQLPRKKAVVINLGFFSERLPVLLWVVAALIVPRSPILALVVFLLSFAWANLGAGAVAPAWQDLIARCFPVNRRGRFLGMSLFVGAGFGALGASLSAWILKTYPFPTNFVYTFGIAAIAIIFSWVFLSFTREPVVAITRPKQSSRQFFSSLPEILRRDHNFSRFLLVRMVLSLGGMGVGFITVAALHRWQIPDSTVGVYTIVLLLGQTAGNLFFGWLSDRFGHKLSLELGILAYFVSFTLAWLAPAKEWFYVVFAFSGIASGAIVVSGILVIMEFCEPQRRPTYAGLTNTSIGLVGMLAPMLGAGIANVNYSLLFAISAAFNLIAWVAMHWWVKDPRWAKAENVLATRQF